MLQPAYRNLVVIAALAAASPMSMARAQTVVKSQQWPLTLQDAQELKLAQALPPAASPAAGHAAGAAAPAAEPAPAHGWTETEIATARARCNAVLARYEAIATPMEPIREGDCGTPYPVQVTSIGKVTLSQPAIVNCEVIAVLGDWLAMDVQPSAKQLLGARVTGLEVLSSYSCRNAYGRKRSRLSEHGRANAIDIKSFTIDRNQPVDLMADWGLTERDIKARIAAAEAAARQHAAAKAKADAEAQAQAKARGETPQAPAALAQRGRGDTGHGLAPASDGLTALRGIVPRSIGRDTADEDRDTASGLSLGQPSRLGGPKAKSEAGSVTSSPAAPAGPAAKGLGPARQMFLRAMHASACRRFGTVLGPEANEAHRNHFHFDLAERGGRGNFCE